MPPHYAADEIRLDQPTRDARLRWAIVVDATLAVGHAANAVACVAANVGGSIDGLLGPAGTDQDGGLHPGLPWAGCTILAADAEELKRLRTKATTRDDVHTVDMPEAAQTNRVYQDYLAELTDRPADELPLLALSVVGPRNAVDRLIGKLPLYR
jgi:hypothetical protein